MAKLDLYDIQGNIVKGYGRFGFSYARHVFFAFHKEQAARQFVDNLIPLITHSKPWDGYFDDDVETKLPNVTTNIAFTYHGLKNLGIPKASLNSFPDEFAMGMKARADILGDDGKSSPEYWDKIWRDNDVDCWISINGTSEENIDKRYQEIMQWVKNSDAGVALLSGHRGDDGQENLDYQSASAIFRDGKPTPKEHFGYADGISDPFFKGTQANPHYVIGNGKRNRKSADTPKGWDPLEAGEFILGHRDEAFETPTNAPTPRLLGFNGTFMVYRKLHQNVGSFNRYLDTVGQDFPGGKEALAAKFAGRWRNGAPLRTFTTQEQADQFLVDLLEARDKVAKASNLIERKWAQLVYAKLKLKAVAFDYNDDIEGARCPVGSHIRRSNPRGALEFGVKNAYATPSALTNRRRILRRGLPYGYVKDSSKDDGEHGIIFMALNASLKRQFEFVQQQWMNYGNDFKLASEKDALIGNHSQQDGGKMVIEGDAKTGKAPFFCSAIPRFVETRGGEYFFIPSITALEYIASGLVDPT